MDELRGIASLTTTISIPATREVDGVSEIISEADIETTAKRILAELEELNFPEILKALGQGVLEEHFLQERPVLDVSAFGG